VTGVVDGTDSMLAASNGPMQNTTTTTTTLGVREGDYIKKNEVVLNL
jgi:Cu(I)/Ag(I) efflux system membrane fusion protein